MDQVSMAAKIMSEFAASTGLSVSENPPRRYLWTDAFAVCNFLELYRLTGDERWRKSALDLVDQVHYVLGRHRRDDQRSGWISNLSEEKGARHPTIGGLRIGKQTPERKPDEPFDEHLEWGRDGQYFHYLTKWMLALNRTSRCTIKPVYNIWAIELAKTAHDAFVYTLPTGERRMHWKMSIDLSCPLTSSMGQHDPLDGLITCKELQATAMELFETPISSLESEIEDMELLCKGQVWATGDPLGIGSLLGDAHRTMQLYMKYGIVEKVLLYDLLESSLSGLDALGNDRFWERPANYRLPFRELGMATGLHAVGRMKKFMKKNPEQFTENDQAHGQVERLERYVSLGKAVEEFWLKPEHKEAGTWKEHEDINSVMLTTTLIPGGYLELLPD